MIHNDSINKIIVKSILTKSGFPDDDYCVNPYSGCAFGCSYCFADFMRRFTGHSNDKWGEYVDVKMNAGEMLEKELSRLEKRIQAGSWFGDRAPNQLSVSIVKAPRNKPSIVIGSVTDPYQGVEAKYKITRMCLEAIKRSGSTANFNILTKGHLVTRDIDLLKDMKNVVVGMTITTTDDKVSRLLEGNAPPASLRLKALKKLNDAGIQTYVCVNPLLPHFVSNEARLRNLFQAISDTGNQEVWLEHINLGGNKFKRIQKVLQKDFSDKVKYFEKAKSNEYKRDLNQLIFGIFDDFDFEIGGGGIFDHVRKTIIVRGRDDVKQISKRDWKFEIVK